MLVRVWWSRDGADSGWPWKVQYQGGLVEMAKTVRFEGRAKTLTNPEGFPLPDGPRGVIEVDGEVFINE